MKPSTISTKYPTFRDDFIRGCFSWLEGKRHDDNAEGLWRVHNKLYDLTDFAPRHPGGKEWIKLTRGTDITDQFESFHLTDKPTKILPKFYVRDANKPRIYKLTYEEDGFYKTLRRRVAEKMKEIDRRPILWSKIYCDVVLITALILCVVLMRLPTWPLTFTVATITGLIFCHLTIICHNFIHKANNWRMYVMNLTLMSWRDWRVFHAMSHHMYPNSYHDMEVSLFEPYLNWLPEKKSFLARYGSWLISPIAYSLQFHVSWWLRFSAIFKPYSKYFHWDEFLGLVIPLIMTLGSLDLLLQEEVWFAIIKVLGMWTYVILTCSFFYGAIALNTGHHGTEIIHEGDAVKSLDFGIYQMGAVADRIEVSSNHYLVLTHFGQHTMHHLFPTIDHGLLTQLNDVLLQTIKEFDLEFRQFTWYKHVAEQFKQLSRTETIDIV